MWAQCPAYPWRPRRLSEVSSVTRRPRCTAGSPGSEPVRRPPTSTSTRTFRTRPARVMACPSSRMFSALSTTTIVSGARSSTPMSRPIFSGPTTSVVTRMLRMPEAAITSASPTLAQQMPTAPAAIWRRAISGHLCVFECGRSFLPTAFTWAAILAMFRSKRSRSRSSAGVGISGRVMARRAYHGAVYHRRHDNAHDDSSRYGGLVGGEPRDVFKGEGRRAVLDPGLLLPRGRLAARPRPCPHPARGAAAARKLSRGAQRLRHRQRVARALPRERLRRALRRLQGSRGARVHGLCQADGRGRLGRYAIGVHGMGQGRGRRGLTLLGESRRALHGQYSQGEVRDGSARALQPLRGRAEGDRHRQWPHRQGPARPARVRRPPEQHRLPRLLRNLDPRLGSSEGGSAPLPKPPPKQMAPAKPALEAEHSGPRGLFASLTPIGGEGQGEGAVSGYLMLTSSE